MQWIDPIWQEAYRQSLREVSYKGELAFLHEHWPVARRVYGTPLALTFFCLSFLSLWWTMFLKACVR